jgi:hypothetical protein
MQKPHEVTKTLKSNVMRWSRLKPLIALSGIIFLATTGYADMCALILQISPNPHTGPSAGGTNRTQLTLTFQAGKEEKRDHISIPEAVQFMHSAQCPGDSIFAVIHSDGVVAADDLTALLKGLSENRILLLGIQVGYCPDGIDIRTHRWASEHGGATKGSQPIPPGTNQPPAPAGSRR